MHVVIVGAGQAAASCVAKLRRLDQSARLTIVGEEPHPPYQRPPLSKKYLSGDLARERLFLYTADWYSKNKVDLRLSDRVESLDCEAGRLTLEKGGTLSYDKLVLATGARPKQLTEAMTKEARGFYVVRTLADVDAMVGEFQPGRRLLVVGGGYIGLEAAAIARKLGLGVTLVEAAPRILGRVAGEATADFIRAMHRSHGVDIIENISLERFSFSDDKVEGARLADGREISVDFVVIGIGITPNSELAQNAGLRCEDGIRVDRFCRTSDEHIYAAGDCTRFEYRGEAVRLESVGNAIDQGEVVAANLAGEPTPYVPKPWFWSDQYDMTLQIAGLSTGYEETVVRPGKKEGTQSLWYYKGDELLAVDALGDPRSYIAGKRIIESGKTLPKEVAANPDSKLKDWL